MDVDSITVWVVHGIFVSPVGSSDYSVLQEVVEERTLWRTEVHAAKVHESSECYINTFQKFYKIVTSVSSFKQVDN